ncbi:MAG: MerC domain-containing protein [Chitinophagaceae bacterium]
MKWKINWDALGVTTSLACAIHCAILPLFLTSLNVLGTNIIDNFYFEYSMIFLALLIGSQALYHGYKKHHHRKLPIVLFCLGILCLFLKQVFHQIQIWLLVPAVILIVSAHYYNYRFCRFHNHAHTDDCNH